MKLVQSELWLTILILLQIRPGYSLLDGFFDRILPWMEEESFAQSFFLGSRISLLPLNSTLQNNFIHSDLYSSSLDELTSLSSNVSDSSRGLCVLHLQFIIKKLLTNQKDASLLSFIDSYAKTAPGVKNGNINWHGSQIQCESTSVSFESDSGSQNSPKLPSNFGGKYCRAEWSTQSSSNQSFKHYTGVCVPNSCSRKDFDLMKVFLEKFFFLKLSDQSHITEISCKGDDKTRTDSVVFYLVCLGLIFLGISSTIYDQCREKVPENKRKRSNLSIFSIFSIPGNWRSLNGEKVSKNDILIIHYIRGISAALVVLFHVGGGLISVLISDSSPLTVLTQLSSFWLLPRSIMTIFFFLTGFLIHRDYSNPDRDFNPFKLVLKAFLRMSPSFYFVVFIQTSYISLFGLGSKHDYGGVLLDRNRCSEFFWTNLLYIQNFSSITESCVFVSWSMAVTFQLYTIGVFVVWILLRSPIIGLILAIFSMISGLVISFKTLYDANLGHLFGAETDSKSANFFIEYIRELHFYIDKFYTQTAVWVCPFMMGILFAYFLPKIQQISHPRKKKSVVVTFSSIIAFYVIFCSIPSFKQKSVIHAALQTVAPVGVTLILSLLIFIFHSDSRFIGYKLSAKTLPSLVHLSRISYPLYLTHYSVLVAILNGASLSPIVDIFTALCIIFGSFCTVYIISIFLYIFIERPIQNIRKIMKI